MPSPSPYATATTHAIPFTQQLTAGRTAWKQSNRSIAEVLAPKRTSKKQATPVSSVVSKILSNLKRRLWPKILLGATKCSLKLSIAKGTCSELCRKRKRYANLGAIHGILRVYQCPTVSCVAYNVVLTL